MNKHTNPHLVNLWQSNEYRKEKYHLCRSLGCNCDWARAMRDWPLVKIERRFELLPHSTREMIATGLPQLNSA